MNEQLALFIDFENVAIWAEGNFFDLEISDIMKYLQGRGPVVVKRAYGDWSRFAKYRDDLLENSIDLVQMYSVRVGKNRADIRLALDAFETAINRSQIGTIAIISGDSDFGALASKLREYGRYILGIGPRAITHPLLVKSCDEFIYLETILGQEPESLETRISNHEAVRALLTSALTAHGKRGELPILGAKLKQTMLSMDPTFNEENLGHTQFRAWLEDNSDLVNLFFKNLQMYVAPVDFQIPDEFAVVAKPQETQEERPLHPQHTSLANTYANIFSKVIAVDFDTRRDVLRDVYRALSEQPGEWAMGALLDELQSRYETKGLIRSKKLLRKVLQLGFHQHCYEYLGAVSVNTPFKLVQDIESQATFIRRVEARFPYTIIRMGLEVDIPEMAATLLDDRTQIEYIKEMLADLESHGFIVQAEGQYRLSGFSKNPLSDDPNLEDLIRELKSAELPDDLDRDVLTARELVMKAMGERTHDFTAASRDLLVACRLQWDAFDQGNPEATLDDMRWYLASYASAKAGELAQVYGRFAEAQSYYLAFFSLVQEDTPLWDRMRGLINPMLSYYWRNLAREINVELGNNTTSPVRIAVLMATHTDSTLREKWKNATEKLASINPEVLRHVANHIRLLQEDSQTNTLVSDQIEEMLDGK